MRYYITLKHPILIASLLICFLGMTSNIRAQADNSKGKIKEQGPKQRKKIDSLINYYQSDTVPRLVPLYVNEV